MILLYMLARTELRNLMFRDSSGFSLRVGLFVMGFVVKPPPPTSVVSRLKKPKSSLLTTLEVDCRIRSGRPNFLRMSINLVGFVDNIQSKPHFMLRLTSTFCCRGLNIRFRRTIDLSASYCSIIYGLNEETIDRSIGIPSTASKRNIWEHLIIE